MKAPLTFLFALILPLFTGCNTGTNEEQTEDQAEEANDEKIAETLEEDVEFLVESYAFSLMLQEYGKTAEQSSSIAEPVKEFASNSVTLHENLNSQIEEITKGTPVTLPKSTGENTQKLVEKLRSGDMEEATNDYIEATEEIHEQMIAQYRDAFGKAESVQVRDFVEVVLPTLEDRRKKLDEMEELTDKL